MPRRQTLRLVIIPTRPKLLLWECQFDSSVNCLACSYSPRLYSCPPLTSLITLKSEGHPTLTNTLRLFLENTTVEKIINCMGFLGLSLESPQAIMRRFQ